MPAAGLRQPWPINYPWELMSKLNPNALKLSRDWPASAPPAGEAASAVKNLARRLRRSPRFWVLSGTLLPALVCTLLAWAYASSLWQLVLYFWYSIPSNSFVYLPNEPGVLFAAAVYSPWVVAVVGGVATMIACIIDYAVIKRVFEFQQVARVKQTGIYKKAIQCFYWRPWPTIAILAVTPLPFYPVRVLAPSSGYPLWRYTSSSVIGRMARYYLLAIGGSWMHVPPQFLILMVVGMLSTPILAVLWARWKLRQAGSQTGDVPGEAMDMEGARD